MLDRRAITDHFEETQQRLSRRHKDLDLTAIRDLADERRRLIGETEGKRHEQKSLGEEMKEVAKGVEAHHYG